MYKSTWKDLRKLKKAQVRKRAAYTKPCRYGASCPNNGCMFYHEGSGYSSSHITGSGKKMIRGPHYTGPELPSPVPSLPSVPRAEDGQQESHGGVNGPVFSQHTTNTNIPQKEADTDVAR